MRALSDDNLREEPLSADERDPTRDRFQGLFEQVRLGFRDEIEDLPERVTRLAQ